MLNRAWGKRSHPGYVKVEEHIYEDGTLHYSFRDGFGKPSNVRDWEEAQEIIKNWRMDDITDKMIEAGWIRRK